MSLVSRLARTRLVHLGVATLLTAAGVTAYELVATAASSPVASVLVPITPCRLTDTRAGSGVGTRNTPIAAGQTVPFAVWGTNGGCTIPSTATGIATNVTTVNPTASSFLTVFPGDAAQPVTSNLNWTPTSPPTPNQVTVGLSATGSINVFNNNGTIDVIIDIVGYYVPAVDAPAGPPGPPGANGTDGTAGAPGPAGAEGAAHQALQNVRWVAASGGDFTTLQDAVAAITDSSSSNPYTIRIAPGTYTTTAPIMLKAGISVVGSGEHNTEITCSCGGSSPAPGGTATLAGIGGFGGSVTDLTVDNTGTGPTAVAIALGNNNSTSLARISAIATSSQDATAIQLSQTTGTLDDVTASAQGTGTIDAIQIVQGSPTLTDVVATAQATGGASSDARGVAIEAGATPSLVTVTANAFGGVRATGIRVGTAFPSISGGSASGFLATTTVGIEADLSSTVFVSGVNASARTGLAQAIVNDSSSTMTVQDSVLVAAGVGFAAGFASAGTLTADSMTITATATSGPAFGVQATAGSATLNEVTTSSTGFGDTSGVSLSTALTAAASTTATLSHVTASASTTGFSQAAGLVASGPTLVTGTASSLSGFNGSPSPLSIELVANAGGNPLLHLSDSILTGGVSGSTMSCLSVVKSTTFTLATPGCV